MAFSKAGVDISNVNAVKQPAATFGMSMTTSSDVYEWDVRTQNSKSQWERCIISIKSHEAAGKSLKYRAAAVTAV
jgi:hypothetical protein